MSESDTALARVLDALSAGATEAAEGLLGRQLASISDLEDELGSFGEYLERKAKRHDSMDIRLARHLVNQCEVLLAGADDELPEEQRRLIQLAVHYLIEDDDAESDLESAVGFDDDAEVIAAVARELGREDVLELDWKD